MPRRKRHREHARKLRKAVERAEVEIEREDAQRTLLVADPLDDIFWRDREGSGRCDPDDDCYFHCPHEISGLAQREINEYLNRGGSQ